jgi:hypothetical protein
MENCWENLLIKYLPFTNFQDQNIYLAARARMEGSVRAFILESLTYIENKNGLSTEIDCVLNGNMESLPSLVQLLPNLTPNGALYPKKELSFVYNQLVVNVREFLGLQFFNQFSFIAAPTIRIKTSSVPDWVAERSTYTGIPHSDAWVGHHGDGVISLIVLGDGDQIGVEFYEPINPKDNYLSNLGSFAAGASTFDSQRYITNMDTTNVYIFDHAVLHGTAIKPGPMNYRVSIDMAYSLREGGASPGITNPDYKRFDYLSVDDWFRIGSEAMLLVDQSIKDVTAGNGEVALTNNKSSSFAPSKLTYFK